MSAHKNARQQDEAGGFFEYLGRNMVPAAILLVLVTGGVIAFLVQTMSAGGEAPKAADRKWSVNDWKQSRYGGADCSRNPHCRQLKRIHEEGGASQEAIRENIRKASTSLSFELLQEDASRYEGVAWAFEGKILDIIGMDTREFNQNVLAEVSVGDDPAKTVSVKGDFATNLAENDSVYVVGYLTGTSHARLGPAGLKYKGSIPEMAVRALLRPSEASDLQKID